MINKYIKAVHDLDEIKFRLLVAIDVNNQIHKKQTIKDLDYLLNDSIDLLDRLLLQLRDEMMLFVDFFVSTHPYSDLAKEIAKTNALCSMNIMKGRKPNDSDKNGISQN